jgi:hypothetical protein
MLLLLLCKYLSHVHVLMVISFYLASSPAGGFQLELPRQLRGR